jgi:dual specificity tyrosine-phosphorylation-regulated kinase 2/3/4
MTELTCFWILYSYLVEKSSRKKLFFDSTGAPRPVVNSKGRRRRPSTKTLSSALNCSDDLFLDFLTKCLHWDPDKRLKPEAALRHPWIKRGSETALAQSSAKPAGQLSSSATLSNISGPTTRRAMFSSMTSSSSSNSLSKSVSSVIKPMNLSSHHGGNAKSALAASQGSSRSSAATSINSAVSKPVRSERRISLRNSLNPNAPTSSPLRSAARSHQQPVS